MRVSIEECMSMVFTCYGPPEPYQMSLFSTRHEVVSVLRSFVCAEVLSLVQDGVAREMDKDGLEMSTNVNE